MNKQNNDWRERFEKWWLDSDRFGDNPEDWTLLHDYTLEFIENLLKEQIEDFVKDIKNKVLIAPLFGNEKNDVQYQRLNKLLEQRQKLDLIKGEI